MIRSISFCLVTSMPTSFGAICSLTFFTASKGSIADSEKRVKHQKICALSTPLPSKRCLSPSRSSRAWRSVHNHAAFLSLCTAPILVDAGGGSAGNSCTEEVILSLQGQLIQIFDPQPCNLAQAGKMTFVMRST